MSRFHGLRTRVCSRGIKAWAGAEVAGSASIPVAADRRSLCAAPLFHHRILRYHSPRSFSATSASRQHQPDHHAGGTFSKQHLLPRLPIPSLQSTAAKYLESCRPLLSEDEYADAVAAVEDFVKPGGIGETLQQRLVELDNAAPNSWLEDIWLQRAYLMNREPSLINVNWWTQFNEHPNQPRELIAKPPPPNVLTSFQVSRAAGLITNLLKFKRMLDSEAHPPETNKGAPLCMDQYRRQFGVTRIPGEKADTLRTAFPATERHIIVLTKDQIYKVDVLRENGDMVPIKEIERLLYAVGKDSLETAPEPGVGIITAGRRDTAYAAYKSLSGMSERNLSNLKTIETALFAVCLDDHSTAANIDISHHQFFHNGDARNRWFDKSMQLIVASSGRAGMNGEHSPSDAVTTARIVDYILENEPATDSDNVERTATLPTPRKLTWDVNNSITALIDRASAEAAELIKETSSTILKTSVYGHRYIKEIARTSPDAYVQLAFQIVWHRLHKQPTAIYESVSTRGFNHGRTEAGRSLTPETWEFARAFDDDDVLYDRKRELFRAAIDSHQKYIREAAEGKGIDRHLLALRTLHNPDADPEVKIFSDRAYSRSNNWRLSTSNMSTGGRFIAGFGPVVGDGYGIAYAIGKDSMHFGISNKKRGGIDGYKFRDTLEQTFKDMMVLFPKRGAIWGPGWEKRQKEERKKDYYIKTMKALSDDYIAKKDDIAKRYLKLMNPDGKKDVGVDEDGNDDEKGEKSP